ncbi:aminotransferase class I/II-fold pyridoxal phosphate-dependent enzyme [Crossiella sp. CA-258035]|uniref:aminotransferase class I/II-fold pyridoxal phosphate-dependent enzyme n=1 Tax=Crossiella sp. CA-258035 TaxID=2981138 RepID=UPI0024BD03AB|nr:aminotransferase class I/II-fold pyridoxal phosphate-dependent enzyme [Crossiella sp. CA-258035]WHT16941.1 aminotransferase class I/II-fold pyridoxal phosphate-dependent enzyme [Crossiella sp. CA-258035]
MHADLSRILSVVEDGSATGIAAAINRLIGSGELAVGTRLPTVRALAQALGVSPTTVNEAWRSLARVGAIETKGRNGSFVTARTHNAEPTRFWRLAGDTGRFARDLSAGVPDQALLPPIGPALARIDGQPPLSGYLDAPVLPELEKLVRKAWAPVCDPETLTIVNGSLDGIDRLVGQLLRLGDRVIVENPTFPPFLDLLDTVGASALPVPVDEEGILPDALAAQLRRDPAVLLMQPRAQNPTGVSLTPRRAAQLVEKLRAHPDVVVIEADHSGDVALAEPVSFAGELPDRVVRVQSFSKSHGPDLRLAALGGPAAIVEPLIGRRHLGAAWSSRLLQEVLVGLLTDPGCVAAVATARTVYARRRAALKDALASRGIQSTGWDGINLWINVAREREALVTLAAQGIGAAPGSPFLVEPTGGDHLRVTTATLPVEEAAAVADALAEAARPYPPYSRV